MGQFLNLMAGVATSLVAWLIVTWLLRPRVEFSEHISRVPKADDPTKFIYRVKVLNKRRYRKVLVDFSCSIRMKGVHLDRPNNFSVMKVPLGDGDTLRIKPRDFRVVWIHPERIDELDRYLPAEIGASLRRGSLRLDELLTVHLEEASLTVFVRCTDGFSGSQALFERTYPAGFVRVGLFEKGRSLQIAAGSVNEKVLSPD